MLVKTIFRGYGGRAMINGNCLCEDIYWYRSVKLGHGADGRGVPKFDGTHPMYTFFHIYVWALIIYKPDPLTLWSVLRIGATVGYVPEGEKHFNLQPSSPWKFDRWPKKKFISIL